MGTGPASGGSHRLGLRLQRLQGYRWRVRVATSNQKAILARASPFPLRVSVQGGLQLSAQERNLEDSIRIILGISLGERIYSFSQNG